MAATRLSGSALYLTVEGVDYASEISSWEYSEDEKESGTVTFGDSTSAAGKLKVVFVQSIESASLHQVIMDHPGKRNVAFVLAPAGNKTPSAEQPHWTGKVAFPKTRPTMGLAAGDVDATSEVEFTVTDWAKVTTPGTRG
ncbi:MULTISPECIES: hypothetical protein [unclassified Actinotignum]|uniref:hypothetical protein n=1 Tax=unclassified Actinotignum TaxID=2632702 RepID=UPI002A80EF3C|nr:hypothetical protein [Actinotignum sp. SLA_B059]MDY5127463.1 hypothetical protein [Actinotignum sp. SLA_B059]